MNAKSMFRIMLLTLSIFTLSTLISTNISQARNDVWFYGNEGFNYYMDADSIQVSDKEPYYTCTVTWVTADTGEFWNFSPYGFSKRNGAVVGFQFIRSHGYWEYLGPIGSDPFYSSLWNAMKPYLK